MHKVCTGALMIPTKVFFLKCYSFLEQCFSSQYITGGTVSTGKAQNNELWSIREHIPTAGNEVPGYQLKFDISTSLENFPVLLEAVKNKAKTLGINGTVLGYGM